MLAGCAAVDFPITQGVRTLTSRKEADEGESTTMSAWHCQQKCQIDPECVWFSWKFGGKDVQDATSTSQGKAMSF